MISLLINENQLSSLYEDYGNKKVISSAYLGF